MALLWRDGPHGAAAGSRYSSEPRAFWQAAARVGHVDLHRTVSPAVAHGLAASPAASGAQRPLDQCHRVDVELHSVERHHVSSIHDRGERGAD